MQSYSYHQLLQATPIVDPQCDQTLHQVGYRRLVHFHLSIRILFACDLPPVSKDHLLHHHYCFNHQTCKIPRLNNFDLLQPSQVQVVQREISSLASPSNDGKLLTCGHELELQVLFALMLQVLTTLMFRNQTIEYRLSS